MKRKDTFKIGELSKLFDVSVDSIRYYEKVGILRPIRNYDNNYRMYTIDDVRRLTLIRELLGLNFSTDKIREYDNNRNIHNTTALLQEELEVIDAEIDKLSKTRNSIQNRLNTIKSLTAAGNFEEICIKEFPDRGCIMINDDNLPDNYVSYYTVRYMQRHQTHIDTIGACDCYTLDIPGSNPDSQYYKTKNVFFYAPYINSFDCNYTLPAGKYMSLTYRGALSKTKQFLPIMYEYAKDHQLSCTGDPIEMCHIDEYETSNESEFIIEIQVKVSLNQQLKKQQ